MNSTSRTCLAPSPDAITTSCTLVDGDFGGPLFDMDGRVIGIHSRIAELLTTNMHVPINAIQERDVRIRLLEGEVWGHLPGQEPWLGVRGNAEAKDAEIETVRPASPAERAGLKPGDVVLAVEDVAVADFAALTQAVADRRPNENVRLKIRRGDEQIEIRVRLGRRLLE